jgi:hypothetical protein
MRFEPDPELLNAFGYSATADADGIYHFSPTEEGLERRAEAMGDLTREEMIAAFGTAAKMFGKDASGRPVSVTKRLAALQELREKGVFDDAQAQAITRAIFRRGK